MLKRHIAENRIKYLCGVVLFVIGVVCGCVALSKLPTDKTESLTSFFSLSAEQGRNTTFISVYKRCLADNFKCSVIFLILSFTLYTCWLCLGLSFIKGFTAGFTSGFLIKNYGVHGLVYTLLGIVPSSLLHATIRIFAAVVCINFSCSRIKSRALGAREALGVVPPLLIVFCIMSVFSLYDALISPSLFKSLF